MIMVEQSFPANPESLESAIAFLTASIREIRCPPRVERQLEVALEEVFTNIVKFAYPDTVGNIVIAIDVQRNTVRICFTDSGIPFNPLVMQDPDLSQSADLRPIGGLGIFMVKRLMDNVTYAYRNQQNILTLTKNIQ